MHVFAGNIRLLRIGLEIFLDFVGVRVHAAFDVGHVVILAIVGHALVVHWSVRVEFVHVDAHRAEHVSRIRFVAKRPDDYGSMVVVALHHAVHTVHARALPFGLAARNGGILGDHVSRQAPAAVRFKIGFVDQVDAVFVAQVVPVFLVGVVRGADGVDVVPLAERDVVDHVLPGDGAAALRVEFVAVGALEDHALAVELHDAVFDTEATEADALHDLFDQRTVMAHNKHRQLIQGWLFGAPRRNVLQRAGIEGDGFVGALRGFPHHSAVCVTQFRLDGGRVVCIAQLQGCIQRSGGHGGIVVGFDLHGFDMHARLCGELHGTEQAVQTPEILIFQPRGARVFVAGDGEHVVAVNVQRFGDVEFVRRETVLAIADEGAVKPHVDRSGHAVEGDADGAAIFQRCGERTVEREGTAVDRHMIVFGNVRLLRILMAIPWILHIHIFVLQIAGHLQVFGHVDRAETGIVEVSCGERRVFHVDGCGLSNVYFPYTVEILLRFGGFAQEIPMIGVRGLAIHREYGRIGEPACVRLPRLQDARFRNPLRLL